MTEEDEVHNTIKLQTILCNDGENSARSTSLMVTARENLVKLQMTQCANSAKVQPCKKPKVPKVNQVVGETHQETNIPPNDTSSSSSIIVIIVFDVVVVVDVVVIFHLSSPNFRSCTLVDEQNSVR